MIHIGKINQLTVSKQLGAEVYLSDGLSGKVLLVDKHLPAHYREGDVLDVFVYVDDEGHLAATCKTPLAQLDEIAWLKVVSINYTGAFLDWGLAKDLLLPFGEQHYELTVGDYCMVKLFMDERGRILATTKINRFIEETSVYFKEGQQVSLMIADTTDLGIKAIINHSHWGMLYQNELFQTVQTGQTLTGYIKHIRDDFKIDLCLHEPGYGKVESLTEQIMAKLQVNGGVLLLGDKTPPAEIYAAFGVSKKVFKQAIGALYKDHKISLDKTSISLVSKP